MEDGAERAGGFVRLGEETIFTSRVFSVARLDLADPDGERFERHVVRHPGAVAVVAVNERGAATLVRQYRPALGRSVLEIPAGTCDVDGEPLPETARRELAEEAGLEAGELRRLAAVYNSPGYSDQLTTVFLATVLTPCPTDRGGVEERFMATETIRLDDLDDLIGRGVVVDETTVLGLWLARAALGIGTA